MKYTQPLQENENLEQGIERLKQTVQIRDKMGGAMYFNILNDDCCELANQLKAKGADRQTIADILGVGNFR